MAIFNKTPVEKPVKKQQKSESSPKKTTPQDVREGSVDVYNTPREIIVLMQLGGVSPSDVVVDVNDDVLTIKSASKLPEEIADVDPKYIHTEECQWGETERSIILPQNVSPGSIKARITKDRVLIVTIPKDGDDEQVIKVEIEG